MQCTVLTETQEIKTVTLAVPYHRPSVLVENSTRQPHREASETREAAEGEVTLSELEATTVQTTVKTTEQTLCTAEKTHTQLNRRAAKAEISESQNASRWLDAGCYCLSLNQSYRG